MKRALGKSRREGGDKRRVVERSVEDWSRRYAEGIRNRRE